MTLTDITWSCSRDVKDIESIELVNPIFDIYLDKNSDGRGQNVLEKFDFDDIVVLKDVLTEIIDYCDNIIHLTED